MRTWLLLVFALLFIGCTDPEETATALQPDDQDWSSSEQGAGEKASQTKADTPTTADQEKSGMSIVTEEIQYNVDGQTFTGYLAYDEAIEGQRPGVLVVHEWWGHNEYARGRAEQLAQLGYTAFALDMYGGGKVTDHPSEAQKFMAQATQNPQQVKARFLKAKDILQSHATTDPTKTAAIGYCFGGGVVLNMARAGVDLDGVASFHGSLAPMFEAEKGDITAKVLVLHGGADNLVPEEQVKAFKQEMETAGADYEFITYPDAQHSFTNPNANAIGEKHGMPVSYDAEADQKSWAELKAFLNDLWTNQNTDQ